MRTTVCGESVDTPARLLAVDLKETKFNKETGEWEPTTKLVVAVSGDTHNGVPIERLYKFPLDGGHETATFCLVNIPVKKTAWINLYKDWTTSGCVYSTEDWAKSNIRKDYKFLATVKVEWEE